MLPLPDSEHTSLPPIPAIAPKLPYEKLEHGKNYWIVDDVLPNAEEIAERCFRENNGNTENPTNPRVGRGCVFMAHSIHKNSLSRPPS